ncbi:MAG TPA: NUDIX domain-containing protein [Pyrinomonadaceae bacterium]|jgi:ADP-ribose pyrophosphatase YjhB (NUDIX family)
MKTKDNAQFFIVLVKGWIKKDDRYLLARRSPKEIQMPGVWSLPGGKIEKEIGRGILGRTLVKEIEEEVGITIAEEIVLIYDNMFQRVDSAYVLGLTFLCRYKSGNPAALEDTTEIRWFSVDELRQLEEAEDFLKIEIEHLMRYLSSHG